ncbi:MAG: hypothetical protein JRN15_19140 [Nitrososphaerota archaeon]|nr:hypothetical protein [Nitrososphaerota archaeon]
MDAKTCLGEIYRLVPHLPVDKEGFTTYFDLYPGREWRDGECMAHGLSVLVNFEAALKLRRRIKGLRDYKIAVACLEDSVGVIKQTTDNPEHHTWWPDDGVDLPSLFAPHDCELTI